MEDISVPSPASSASASDSDAYNTESARLYFGPLKTPERKFVDNSKGLFPLPTFLRRSPRLSSPRLTSPSQSIDEDIDLVVQLIKAPSEDEEDFATPQAGDGAEDEPSSVLANRVMHALDNPSPPPSPTLPLSFFDPYHTTTPQSPTDYQNILSSLSMNNRPEHGHDNPLLLSTTTYSKAQTSGLHLDFPSQVLQQDLISFDSVPAVGPSKEADSSLPLKESVYANDFLSHYPSSASSHIQQTLEIPDLVVKPPVENLLVDMDLAQTEGGVGEDSNIVPHNSKPQARQLGAGHILPQPSNIETPVRRSPRPRTSLTPNLAPPLAVVSLQPSDSRTQIKKKLTIDTFDEIVDDSQEEQDVEERFVQQALSQATPSALWSARQRSPTRSPMSFNRVLGSLSPKSTDLLAKLAFTSTEEPNISIGHSAPSSDSQTQFTFSMFPTLPGSVLLNTPSTSPHKIRLQTPAPNNPVDTPARRIPIEQGIAQGHVSPQKAAQLGFKPDGTLLTSIQTPARRVLISEFPVTKTGGIRFGTLSKGKEREQSIGPSSRPVNPRRKEREKTPGQSSTETLAKFSSVQPDILPFPLVVSNPAPSTSSPIVPEISQSNLPQAKPTNVKSYLRQPTSRIPRIGTKPYARPPALISREKNPSTSPKRSVDLAKSTAMESASIPSNARSPSSSISRLKPSDLTSTTLLKRKRDVEKLSPIKPRIITLRQVPKVATPTITTSSMTRNEPSAIPNLKKTSQNSVLRPNRIMDSESCKGSHSMTQGQGLSRIMYNPRPTETDMKTAEVKESSPPLPPGSLMAEDPPGLLHDVLEPQSKAVSMVPNNVATSDASSSLRRTTRSRRNPVNEGKSRPLPNRRKPASSRSDDVFSGMSMTALKDLTMSNTARNQEYLIAKLETEVIRKEGDRPESPPVKVRTVVQRQMEEKLKERAERATRRARRSNGDMVSSDVEGSSDVGYSSPCEDRYGESIREPLPKHRRGPGDEEDYETPERPDRHKRLLVEADDQVGETERRVKWDRGLFTSVYLDEVKLGSRQPLKENRSLKGILTSTAKALRLDTLGNLPQADLPLTDLVQENITIKKFVYDNDVEPVPEFIVVKNTRSKSKKSRS